MELPIELKLASEGLAMGMSQGLMTDSAKELSRRYMSESGTGKSLLTKSNEALVYSLMRMPGTFGAVASILEQVCMLSDFIPRSLLDAGAGTGTGSWAANQYFLLDRVTCMERESAMINIGKQLMCQSSDEALKRATWVQTDLTEQAKRDIQRGQVQYESDLVIASYVLNEMAMEDRMQVVDWLWKNTKKMLVIVEPGTPVGSDNIRRIRDYLIEQGAYVVAPCTHMERCPVKCDDWCHFTCRVQRGKLHRLLKEADAPYEDEKYSYITVSREKVNTDSLYGRIRRHPITEKGRITLEMCTREGILSRTVTKKEGDLYKAAKKKECGDMFSL